MKDPLVRWHVHGHKNIRSMYHKTPCEARITMARARISSIVKVYLIQPIKEGVRARDAYQNIITLEFPEFHGWTIDTQVEHAAKYIRIAEVKFGLEITKILFRGKEVTCK